MSNRADVGDLENSLPYWISKHLGEKSYMTDEVNQLHSSPFEEPPLRDDSSDHGEDPEMAIRTPLEKGAQCYDSGQLRSPEENVFLPGWDPGQDL
ncbi:hypothetical protein Acr_25g0000470 [Actinidia rufa]|uniref:Uncharacterized protein n=1 Tax=Actinidia rufa TaxID=165716 RepID=A0A7J0GY33_9ERIC|nr:hypothetical protein Acr_25g0000470 [Actinidia rufa]